MAGSIEPRTGQTRRVERYLTLLAVVLLGYALFGKGFAYIGFAPLYVGEIALLAGIVAFLKSGALVAATATLPSVLLVVTMSWVLVRTVPFIGDHGADALRDSVIVMYGSFAFIVAGLVLEDARRIGWLLRCYGTLVALFPVVPLGYVLSRYRPDLIPVLPGSGMPALEIGASGLGAHVAGVAVYVLAGYRRVSWVWTGFWFAGLALAAATNRGAFLAVVVPLGFAVLVLGQWRLLMRTLATASIAFAALYAAEAVFWHHEEVKDSTDRMVSAHQIADNIQSIAGESGRQTAGTKKWRLDWWNVIIADTLHGPNFWTGRGFGTNLAAEDGFLGTGDTGPPTRSPHNAQMTVLARAGVPGLVLWLLVLAAWGGMMVRALFVARARGDEQWQRLFLFVLCYATALVIVATFDVALESPVQGIWFWCLFGLGLGSVMVYRAQVADDASR